MHSLGSYLFDPERSCNIRVELSLQTSLAKSAIWISHTSFTISDLEQQQGVNCQYTCNISLSQETDTRTITHFDLVLFRFQLQLLFHCNYPDQHSIAIAKDAVKKDGSFSSPRKYLTPPATQIKPKRVLLPCLSWNFSILTILLRVQNHFSSLGEDDLSSTLQPHSPQLQSCKPFTTLLLFLR